MIYAKQIKDGVVVSVLTYNYNPHLSEDSGTVAITKEEYEMLLAELRAKAEAAKAEAAKAKAEESE